MNSGQERRVDHVASRQIWKNVLGRDGQIIGILIFWAAGIAAAHFWLRDDDERFIVHLRRNAWMLPTMGAMLGLLIFVLAWATTS